MGVMIGELGELSKSDTRVAAWIAARMRVAGIKPTRTTFLGNQEKLQSVSGRQVDL
jgi:hypothetical protein